MSRVYTGLEDDVGLETDSISWLDGFPFADCLSLGHSLNAKN